MKYIRTEDGIYEDAGTDALGWRCVRYKGNKIVLSQDDDKIVKEADAIEELCDEFVFTNKMFPDTGHILKKDDLDKKQELIFHIKENHVAIYGAIWTEWGLKYVAKMNDKGEFELL